MQRFRTPGGRTGHPDGQVAVPGARPPALPRAPAATGSAVGRVLRFAIVGGGGTIVNMAALYALHRWFRLPLVTASVVAVELAVIHNYLLNDWWTFGTRAPSVRRFAKFNVSTLAGLAVNVLLVWALTRGGMHFLLANGFGIAAGFAVNFVSSTGWVWGREGL